MDDRDPVSHQGQRGQDQEDVELLPAPHIDRELRPSLELELPPTSERANTALDRDDGERHEHGIEHCRRHDELDEAERTDALKAHRLQPED